MDIHFENSVNTLFLKKNLPVLTRISFLLFTGPGKFYRISSHNLKLPPHTNGIINFDTLNSIGSDTGSLSDIHTERYVRIQTCYCCIFFIFLLF